MRYAAGMGAHSETLFSDKHVLVTGAASGIGRATALWFSRRGARLVLCDRDEIGLQQTVAELPGELSCAHAAAVDVADRAQMEAFADSVHREIEAVDILINNAGVGLAGRLLETSLADFEWVLSINLMGVVHGCQLFVPAMIRRGRGGHVVNLSSVAGLVGLPGSSGYVTSKYAVLGLSEALRGELRPHRIGVSAICPGLIRTRIAETTRLSTGSALRRADLVQLFTRGRDPEVVARAIGRAVERDRAVMPVTVEAWAFYYLKRLSPRLAERALGLLDRWAAKAIGG